MHRRSFLTLLGTSAAAWPPAARAQQPAMPVIGFLNGQSPGSWAGMTTSFLQGLNEAGYVEGRNVAIEYRWAEGQPDRLPALAADLVRRQVALITASGGNGAAIAAKDATASIPVVFTTNDDPRKYGLVASLNRPGGNVTGVSWFSAELGPKRLGLLHELVPSITTVALLLNPNSAETADQPMELQEAARTLGLQLVVLNATTGSEIDAAFTTIAQQNIGALILAGDAFLNSKREQIIALAARYAVPAMYVTREMAESGGLLSYGNSLKDGYRRLGIYAGRILKGEKPADLPVEQAVRFELIINLKTAKTLGITVPVTLITIADEVIE